MKYLIDDSLTLESGNRANTYIEYLDQPEITKVNNPDVLALEFQLGPISGISGYKLTEEEQMPDGSISISQEFMFAPDIAYSLFLHWLEIDKNS